MPLFYKSQVAAEVPYDNTSSGLTSDNVQDAIDEVSTGSSPGSENFSIIKIESTETKTIPTNQQMLYSGNLDIEGSLIINGKIEEILDYSSFGFSWNFIPNNLSLKIPTNRDLIFVSPFIIDGQLIIDGRMIEVG
jgi:hypothetical protein